MRVRTSVLRAGIQPREVFINRLIALGLGMVAGTALGAVAISQLQAQAKAPSAYAIVDISEITNPELMKQLAVKAGPAVAAAGGHLIARTENIVALDGTPPKRFVIIGFDGMDKAKILVRLAGAARGQCARQTIAEIAHICRRGNGQLGLAASRPEIATTGQ